VQHQETSSPQICIESLLGCSAYLLLQPPTRGCFQQKLHEWDDRDDDQTSFPTSGIKKLLTLLYKDWALHAALKPGPFLHELWQRKIRGFWIPYEEDLALWKLKKAMKTEIVLDIQDSQLRETVWSFSPKHKPRSTKLHYSSFPLEDGGSEEFLKMQVRGRTWWPTWKASLLPLAYVQWASSNFTIWNIPILVWLSCTLNLMVD